MRYTPSEKFLSELMPESITKEQEVASQKDQKDTNDLNYVTEIIKLGAGYWQRLLEEGTSRAALSYAEQDTLRKAVDFAQKGNIPCSASGKVPARTMALAKSIYDVKDKLESLGIKI